MSVRLKSLTLHGFKTFVQRTQLELDSGITAVVGPNGSGKSNLADAVRWALGEQSLRAIRGRRTEDVLFSGGNGRPPAGFAEVAVTFESTDHPGEEASTFPYIELSIARRAYRSGENEYYVNRERVRLKDVVDLYGQLGLGLDGFALVGQGEVDAALSVRAEDRRELVAQAAGLGHLQGRLADSLAKLSLTEQNLGRVSDLIEELTPRLRTLERQARQARERESLQEEFSRGLVRWYADHWVTPWQCHLRATVELAAAEEIRCEATRRTTMRESELADISRQMAEVTVRLEDANRHAETLSADHEASIRVVRSDEDRVDALQDRQADATENAQHWQDALVEESGALVELDRQRDDLGSTTEQIARGLAAASRDVDNWQVEKRALTESVRLERSRLASAESLRSKALARTREIEERLAQLAVSLDEHRRQVAPFDASIDAERRALIDLTGAVESAQSTIRLADARQKLAAGELDRVIRSATTSANQLDEVDREFQHLRTRFEAMKSVEESGAGYFPGVRAVLRAAKPQPVPSLAGIVGIVARLLDVPDDLEVAIETALGSHGQDIVVERWVEAEAAIALLKTSGGGRATFLPLDTLRPPRRSSSPPEGPGVIGVGADLVGIDRRYAIVSDFLLGQTLLVEDLRVARAVLQTCAPFWQIVTRVGEVARPSGVVTGGSAATSRGALARQRELRSTRRLESEVAARREVLAREAAASREGVSRARSSVATAEQELNATRETLRQNQSAFRDAQTRLDRSIQQAESQRAEVKRRQAELTTLEGQRSEARNQVEVASAAVETMIAAVETAESSDRSFATSGRDPSAIALRLRGQLDLEQRKLKGLDADRARVAARRTSILDRFREYDRQLATSRNELVSVTERLKAGHCRLAELANLRSAALENVARLNVEYSEIRQCHDHLASDGRLLELESQRADAAVREVAARLERTEVELDGLRRQVMLELGNIEDEAIGGGKFTVQSADGATRSAPLERLPEGERLKDRLDALRSRLKVLTPGADAVTEYEAARDRVEFLRRQHDDLTRSTQTLRQAIEETRSTMRERFDFTFARVSAAFSRRFAELFGGGSAALVLDPDGDGTGIEVVAQPPGKRSQSLATLSGGERALTAASLLFALIEASPPPFCLLDEVDAALDESNVMRFCASLKELAAKTQFLVITHNRRTMEAASAICGLTLEGHCESRVLAIRLPIGS